MCSLESRTREGNPRLGAQKGLLPRSPLPQFRPNPRRPSLLNTFRFHGAPLPRPLRPRDRRCPAQRRSRRPRARSREGGGSERGAGGGGARRRGRGGLGRKRTATSPELDSQSCVVGLWILCQVDGRYQESIQIGSCKQILPNPGPGRGVGGCTRGNTELSLFLLDTTRKNIFVAGAL